MGQVDYSNCHNGNKMEKLVDLKIYQNFQKPLMLQGNEISEHNPSSGRKQAIIHCSSGLMPRAGMQARSTEFQLNDA
jgi:hypothetical protein